MFRSKLVPVAMATVFALIGTGVAFAARAEQENGAEMDAILNAKISLTQAIATAENHVGGRATRVNVDRENGAYVYKVRVAGSEKLSEVYIDPASGNVIRSDVEGTVAKMDKEDQAVFAKLVNAGTTLTSSVTTAEQETGGKAIEAAFTKENGTMLFEVEVAKDNAMHKVAVDPATGKMVKVAAAENGESGEGDEEEGD